MVSKKAMFNSKNCLLLQTNINLTCIKYVTVSTVNKNSRVYKTTNVKFSTPQVNTGINA